jgi:hypothetical protein
MAGNNIPTNTNQLIGLANKMLTGLSGLGTSLGITQITPEAFQADLNAFTTEESSYIATRSSRQADYNRFHSAEKALTDWLQITRNVLAARFGSRWSTAWAQAGFVNASTALPVRIQSRIALALRLINYFTANPTAQVASMNVTAAQGTTLRSGTLSAQDALMTSSVLLNTKSEARATAQTKLVDAMRALIKILEATLAKSDPRWEAFGLRMPASKSTPGRPQNLRATINESGAVIVECDPVPLAHRYRWRMRMVGVDLDYQLAARSVNPIAAIRSIQPGHTVEIIVQAVTDNLQGTPSEPLLFTHAASQHSGGQQRATCLPAEKQVTENLLNGSNGRNGDSVHSLARAAA